ncbi:hypothetical protein ANANG_G00164470 [Anguilla anguilla]|uniref:Uncharacterized protein n=1 Tax=Anguilla anguilla TaxID=7936 RepID=A0A9D3M8Y7_ANGAN|nr:hypothetical protein ANANG_G00164470 [Anguilla anguilla]
MRTLQTAGGKLPHGLIPARRVFASPCHPPTLSPPFNSRKKKYKNKPRGFCCRRRHRFSVGRIGKWSLGSHRVRRELSPVRCNWPAELRVHQPGAGQNDEKLLASPSMRYCTLWSNDCSSSKTASPHRQCAEIFCLKMNNVDTSVCYKVGSSVTFCTNKL